MVVAEQGKRGRIGAATQGGEQGRGGVYGREPSKKCTREQQRKRRGSDARASSRVGMWMCLSSTSTNTHAHTHGVLLSLDPALSCSPLSPSSLGGPAQQANERGKQQAVSERRQNTTTPVSRARAMVAYTERAAYTYAYATPLEGSTLQPLSCATPWFFCLSLSLWRRAARGDAARHGHEEGASESQRRTDGRTAYVYTHAYMLTRVGPHGCSSPMRTRTL